MALIQACEEDEQAAIFDWARFCSGRLPELGLLYHIPNGGLRSKAEAGKFQRGGVKAGVPDICLPVARCGFHGLYIELKTIHGRISDRQLEWNKNLKLQGYCSMVCFGADEAISFIEKYIKGAL